MLRDAYPLMINQLLATLFLQVAMLLLELLIPRSRVLGWYSAAYKYVDAVRLIPAYFTLALFPLMSRYAESGRRFAAARLPSGRQAAHRGAAILAA
jgi:O-antigen/teichoic acid export membrane protein